jgi:hypothetical protein
MGDYVDDKELEQEYLPHSRKVAEDITDAELEPEQVVKFGQRMRKLAFNQVTDHGTNLQGNLGDALQILRDMDAAALTTRKLNIEDKVANDGRKMVEIANAIRKEMGGDPYAITEENQATVRPRTTSPLPAVRPVIPVELRPGEDAQGEQVLSVANYIREEE